MKRLLTLAVLMLGVSTSVYAQDYGKTIIDFIAGGGSANPAGETSLLSTLSYYLNFIALAMMAWLAMIGSATFIIQTANKGTPGGQVISSFWMPIRICAATILLIPGTTGYSALQYGVMTIAEKGNNVGNTVMGAGLNYIYNNGVYRSPSLADGSGLIMSWVAAEVCSQYINSYTGSANTIVPQLRTRQSDGYYITELGYDWNEQAKTPDANNPRKNYCGNISFRIEDPISKNPMAVVDSIFSVNGFLNGNPTDQSDPVYAAPEKIAKNFETIINKIKPDVAKIAEKILHDQNALNSLQSGGADYQTAFENAYAQTPAKIGDAAGIFQNTVATYNSTIKSLVATAVKEITKTKNHDEDWKQQTIGAGWPALGTVFWQIQMSQMQINGAANTYSPTYLPPSPDDSFKSDARFVEVAARVDALQKKYAEIKTSSVAISPGTHPLSAISDAGAEGSGAMDKFKSFLFNAAARPYKALLYKNNDDIIINMQYFGSVAGATADNLFWAKTLAHAMTHAMAKLSTEAVDSLKNVASKVPLAGKFLGGVIGGTAKPVVQSGAELASVISDDVSNMLDMVVFYLIIVAFVLAVLLPSIPLIQWFMGVISWLLFFIECLLVSPMWLAAHGTAEKEGWGSEHTRQGYMLMIGLFLAPTLRVVGFLAIFLALKPIGALASWFIEYINGVIVSGFISPFMILASMAAVTIFCYTSMSRIFALPSELFERGLRWINGGQEVTGDSSAEKESRHNIAAFSSKSENAGIQRAKGKGVINSLPSKDKPPQQGN